MKIILSTLLSLSFLLPFSSSRADVEQTTTIDVIAAKPDQTEAILILNQFRPWNDETLGLFNKKIEFYCSAISSGALVKQKPALSGKTFRIIVVYRELPSDSAVTRLKELKLSLSNIGVTLLWGEQKDLKDLATQR